MLRQQGWRRLFSATYLAAEPAFMHLLKRRKGASDHVESLPIPDSQDGEDIRMSIRDNLQGLMQGDRKDECVDKLPDMHVVDGRT